MRLNIFGFGSGVKDADASQITAALPQQFPADLNAAG